MKGKDFVNSKWCKKAADPQTQSWIKQKFASWATRVNNTGLLSRSKQLYQFFLSPSITGPSKITVAGALLYILSPLDLIPDFIPVAGWMDDLGIANFVLSYIASQLDNIELGKMKHLEQNTDSATTEELLNRDIEGIGDSSFSLNANETQSEFCLDLPQESKELQKRLAELTEIADTLHFPDSEKFASQVENRICMGRMQKVAVIGRYSTGKSTLVNALLGKDILPTAPTPTTKAITFIMKGKTPSLYTETENGDVIVHESVNDITNPNNSVIQTAKKINLTLPDFPFDDLIIIDTPGIEDPSESVVQLTLDIIPETDAVIVLLDANYMQSKREFEFISSLLHNDKERKLFIVINKIDGKTPEEIERLEKFCQSHLISYNVPNARIFPISAKDGSSDAGFVKFQTALYDFLRNEIRAEAYRHTDSELKAYSQLLYNSCSTAIKNCAADKKKQEENARAAAESREEILHEYDGHKLRAKQKFEKYKSQFFLDFSSFMDSLKAEVRGQIQISKLDTLKNTDHIAAEVKRKIVSFVDGRLHELDKNIKVDLMDSQCQIDKYLSGFSFPIEINVKDYAEYSGLFMPTVVAASYVFCGVFATIGTAVVAMIGQNFFESAIERFLRTVGINKIRENLTDEVFKNIDKIKKELEAKFENTFGIMENEMLSSFDAACKKAAAPLSLLAPGASCSVEDISNCRGKLETLIRQ